MYRTVRTLLMPLYLLLVCGLLATQAVAAVSVKAVRLWPSPEYSRITLELAEPVAFKHFELDAPARFVLDLDGIALEGALQQIGSKVSNQDPLISAIRVGLNRPGTLRMVIDLKMGARPQVFSLPPTGEYGHRLVIDLYPDAPGQDGLAKQVEQAIVQAGQAGEVAQPAKAMQGASNDRPKAMEFKRLITIAIDAGHGGEDPGALGARGTHEKDVTLAIARRVKAQVEKFDNMRAVLIRDGDYFVPLHERVRKARRHQADLFVSIHADAFLKPEARGSSVFALSENGATSVTARWLAKRENDADLMGGVNLASYGDESLRKTLLDLSQTATISDSLKLGKAVLQEISTINTLHKPHVEQAGFAVLKSPDIPSILVETAFISNPDEEARLKDDAYQDKMAAAIVNGIKRYFDNNPPLARVRVATN